MTQNLLDFLGIIGKNLSPIISLAFGRFQDLFQIMIAFHLKTLPKRFKTLILEVIPNAMFEFTIIRRSDLL